MAENRNPSIKHTIENDFVSYKRTIQWSTVSDGIGAATVVVVAKCPLNTLEVTEKLPRDVRLESGLPTTFARELEAGSKVQTEYSFQVNSVSNDLEITGTATFKAPNIENLANLQLTSPLSGVLTQEVGVFTVTPEVLLCLLQGAQESEPPVECHTEIQTEVKEGATPKIVCVGKCKKGTCQKVEKPLGKSRKLVACVCNEDNFAERCNLILAVKGNNIETSFCVGDCDKRKQCKRGFKLEKGRLRIFCHCA